MVADFSSWLGLMNRTASAAIYELYQHRLHAPSKRVGRLGGHEVPADDVCRIGSAACAVRIFRRIGFVVRSEGAIVNG